MASNADLFASKEYKTSLKEQEELQKRLVKVLKEEVTERERHLREVVKDDKKEEDLAKKEQKEKEKEAKNRAAMSRKQQAILNQEEALDKKKLALQQRQYRTTESANKIAAKLLADDKVFADKKGKIQQSSLAAEKLAALQKVSANVKSRQAADKVLKEQAAQFSKGKTAYQKQVAAAEQFAAKLAKVSVAGRLDRVLGSSTVTDVMTAEQMKLLDRQALLLAAQEKFERLKERTQEKWRESVDKFKEYAGDKAGRFVDNKLEPTTTVGGAVAGVAEAVGGKVVGTAVKAGVKVVEASLDKEIRALDAMQKRTYSFGLSNKGTSIDSVTDEMKSANTTIASARIAAVRAGQDPEQAFKLLSDITSETGATFQELQGAASRISNFAKLGFGSMDDYAANMTKRVRESGNSIDDVMHETDDVMKDAESTIVDGVRVISNADFYKGLSEVRGQIDSLDVSQRNLSKTFSLSAQTAARLGYSMDRTARAAANATTATASMQEGFATYRYDNSMQAAMQAIGKGGSLEKNEQAKAEIEAINRDFKSGKIDQGTAAKFLSKSAASTSNEMMTANLRFAGSLGSRDRAQFLKAIFGDKAVEDQATFSTMDSMIEGVMGGKSLAQLQESMTPEQLKASDALKSSMTSMIEAKNREDIISVEAEELIKMSGTLGSIAKSTEALNETMTKWADKWAGTYEDYLGGVEASAYGEKFAKLRPGEQQAAMKTLRENNPKLEDNWWDRRSLGGQLADMEAGGTLSGLQVSTAAQRTLLESKIDKDIVDVLARATSLEKKGGFSEADALRKTVSSDRTRVLPDGTITFEINIPSSAMLRSQEVANTGSTSEKAP
jgi:hypothetical protein